MHFVPAAVVIVMLTTIGLAASGCRADDSAATATAPPGWHASSFEAMATRVDVLLPVAEADAAGLVRAAFVDVEERMNEWRPSSALGALNQAAGKRPVPVPADLRSLLKRGVEIGARTEGAFDVTWAALWGLWDFRAERPAVPSLAQTSARASLVDYRALVINDDDGTVWLPREGMKVGLGGIAKGYALERAVAALHARGTKSFLLSAGGQVYASGRKDGRPWRVGIRDPRGAPDDWFAMVDVQDASLSTSGDYERFFEVDGARYSHILDPRNGRPARGLRSATVLAKDATLADALSTALFVLGPVRGLALVEGWTDVESLLVDDNGDVHMTTGFKERVKLIHSPLR